MSMEEIIRPFQRPEKSQGYRAPSPKGTNQGTPAITFGAQRRGAPADPYARTDEPEDWGRWPQLRSLLAGGQELASDWRDVSGSVELNPNACTEWLLRCHSESLNISFASLEALPRGVQGTIFATAVRATTVSIVINWQHPSSGVRGLTLSGVLFPDSTMPDWTVAAGMDLAMVKLYSNGLMIGRAVALALGEPS
jgi:hypothetical protein